MTRWVTILLLIACAGGLFYLWVLRRKIHEGDSLHADRATWWIWGDTQASDHHRIGGESSHHGGSDSGWGGDSGGGDSGGGGDGGGGGGD